MNYSNGFLHRLRKHFKTYCYLSIPLTFCAFILIRKRRSASHIKDKPISKPITTILSNSNLHQDISNYFHNVFSSKQIQNSITNKLYEVITSKELNSELRNYVSSTINELCKDKEFMNEIKGQLSKLINNDRTVLLTSKFISYINNHYTTEEVINQFLYDILTSSSVVERVSLQAMECCRNAMNESKTTEEFNSFVKEAFTNEEMVKYIYSKAFDFFSTNTKEKDYKI